MKEEAQSGIHVANLVVEGLISTQDLAYGVSNMQHQELYDSRLTA